MNTINKRKQMLIESLKNKEYRDEYVSAGIDVGIAFQIKALREQQQPKSWTQTDLATRANMHQERIHELEDPSHSPTIRTLKKLAAAFDVGLIVRFVPFSDLVKWDINLSAKSLEIPSFEQEDYFKETEEEIIIDAYSYQKYSGLGTGKSQGEITIPMERKEKGLGAKQPI